MVANTNRGKFIVVAGCDEDENLDLLAKIRDALKARGLEVYGMNDMGSEMGLKIKSALMTKKIKDLDPMAQLMLEAGIWAQVIRETIRPLLESGKTVLASGFLTSLIAHHEAAGHDMATVGTAVQWATGGLEPDLTLVLECDMESAHHALFRRWDTRARVSEDSQFLERVRQSYLRLARDNPGSYRVLEPQPDVNRVIGMIIGDGLAQPVE